MTHPRSARTQRAPRHAAAAVLVDYANLHALLAERLDARDQASSHIAEALGELRRYLADEDGTSTVLTAAYADFGALGDGNLQQALYHRGVEPRYVPAAPQASAVEVQLSVDATTLLHRRPDVETVALVTGDRPYLPLVRALRREGAHAFVVALDPPPPGELTHAGGDIFMDFLNLIGDAARRDLLQSGGMPESGGKPARRGEDDPSAVSRPEDRYDRIEDDMLFRTLEIAEEHFGQYDEVYLTPLLRKLSDVLGERFDPKALVSDLEDAGAVRLEKRRGYPYDYTVLIVSREHPDVQQMEEDFYDGEPSRYKRGGAASGSASSTNYASDGYDEADQNGDKQIPSSYDEDEGDRY